MKVNGIQAAFGSALLFSSAQLADATHGHRLAHAHYGKRAEHTHHHHASAPEERDVEHKVEKRAACALPNDPDIVYVPGAMNGGWAIAPDRACLADMYCPIACVSGKVMNQWKPDTGYHYPESMYGGLYCDGGGVPRKPFQDRPYCVEGTGAVKAVNTCGKGVAFCQTTLPGDEAMVIPTWVSGTATLAVPDPSYWAATSAHYYINPPGYSTTESCVWGDPSKPIGNWSPYVAGANTVASGDTFVKLGWNPIFIDSPLKDNRPTFGLRIECESGRCNGLPCEINPATVDGFKVKSNLAATGAGGADFCVVTVPKGETANIVVFNTDGSSGSVAQTPPPPSSSAAPPAPSSTTSSSSSASSSSSSSSSQTASRPSTVYPGIFHENATYPSQSNTNTGGSTKPSGGSTPTGGAPQTKTSQNDAVAAGQGGAAVVGLVVAVVAGFWLY